MFAAHSSQHPQRSLNVFFFVWLFVINDRTDRIKSKKQKRNTRPLGNIGKLELSKSSVAVGCGLILIYLGIIYFISHENTIKNPDLI